MKSLILMVLATLLVCNSAFAIEKPTSAVAPEGRSVVSAVDDTEAPRGEKTGLDLSNIPPQLRWLVMYAWMLTHQSLSFKG